MDGRRDLTTSLSLWEKAFDDLNEHDKKELQIGPGSGTTDIDIVVTIVQSKRDECVKEQWVLYTNTQGDSVLVRDVINKVSDWIVIFREVGDNVVQYDPGHAALSWAAVRLLLQLTVNDCQTFGAMLESIETVASIVARYAALESRVLIHDSVLTKQLSAALVLLYAASLSFLAHARRYFADSSLTLKNTINTTKTYVGEPLLAIEKREGEVFKLVMLVQNEIAGSRLEDILSTIKQNMTSLKASTEARRNRLVTLINGIDTRNNYESALQYHHDGTCDWALRLQEFHDWKSQAATGNSLLWIHGPAGFGKTFMSVWIVLYLKQSMQIALAYFFCVADNQATRDPYAILRSWLVQILEQDDAVVRLMSSLFTTGDKEQTLTYRELWDLFVAVGDAIPGIGFVVDGFDECTAIDGGAQYHRNKSRNHFLLSLLKSLAKTRSRVLVVSRDVHNIFEKYSYRITAEDTTADVRSFSEFMVNEKLPKKKIESRQKIADQAA
ncbi:hypothetical protein EJ04DRAFT_580377 [Polyplosphaeria fusca]|uniref:NACHT domain-containing protein n=1 Tax=Polyplosphaeria fusca TaxID=682080 RepID=A0A9P4QS07_9PLEO|nr:hypothetical protein EJ04DRAFT_580377 [Polyplosphaeria fusca]